MTNAQQKILDFYLAQHKNSATEVLKTSEDIINDLSDMEDFSVQDISCYLSERNYDIAENNTGFVAWKLNKTK